jgi:ubiquitin carboxyl-terminal hydrolase 19
MANQAASPAKPNGSIPEPEVGMGTATGTVASTSTLSEDALPDSTRSLDASLQAEYNCTKSIDIPTPHSMYRHSSSMNLPNHYNCDSDFDKTSRTSFDSDRPNTSGQCSPLSSCDLAPLHGSRESSPDDPIDRQSCLPSIQVVQWKFVEYTFSETLDQVHVKLLFTNEYKQRLVEIHQSNFTVTVESKTGRFESGFKSVYGSNGIFQLSSTANLAESIHFDKSSYELLDDCIQITLIKQAHKKWGNLETEFSKSRYEMCRDFVVNLPQQNWQDPIDDDLNQCATPSVLLRIEQERQQTQLNMQKSNYRSNSYVDRPLRVGYTGLDNLGNTCFMNTILQCLSNTQEVREYFRTNAYEADLNVQNPFGCGGKSAKSFSLLIRQLWNGSQSTFSPKHFRNSIGDKVNLFSDFNQHDALEYMEHFMDMLHEDINRVDRRPPVVDTPLPKSESELSNEQFAHEMWMRHKRRNDSLVIDLFHGQLKSKLDCPVCPKVSLTFDPFLYLPIPLPKQLVEYTAFFFDKLLARKPSKITMRLPLDSKVNVLLDTIASNTGVSHHHMQAYLFKNNQVNRQLTSGQVLPPPMQSDQLLAVFELHSDSPPTEEFVFNILVHQRLAKPQLHTHCSACNSTVISSSPIVCTKCQKAVYCNSACHAQHAASHASDCTFTVDLVGFPFLITIPASQLTYETLVDRIMNCSRYSVDVTEPSRVEPSDSMESEPMEIGSLPRTHTSIMDESMLCVDKFEIGLQPEDLLEQLKEEHVLSKARCADPIELSRILKECPSLVLDWQNGHILNRDRLVESKDLDHSCHYYDTKLASGDSEHTLEDCLRLFTEPEILSLEDSWHCPDCKKPREACKQLTIWRLPQILVIQLKRFAYKNSNREKIKKFIRFPLHDLDMSSFCSSDQPDRCLYDLYAVVNHFGGIYSGHYTTAARTTFDGSDLGKPLPPFVLPPQY